MSANENTAKKNVIKWFVRYFYFCHHINDSFEFHQQFYAFLVRKFILGSWKGWVGARFQWKRGNIAICGQKFGEGTQTASKRWHQIHVARLLWIMWKYVYVGRRWMYFGPLYGTGWVDHNRLIFKTKNKWTISRQNLETKISRPKSRGQNLETKVTSYFCF